MPRISSPAPVLSRLLLAGALIGGSGALAACGTPPELRQPVIGSLPSGPPTTPAPTPGTPSSPPPAPLPPLPTTPGVAATTAAPCPGKPSRSQILALLHGPDGPLAPRVRASVTTGPICAADWQYTVVAVPGHEAMQVVSRGRPEALTLVTAGTDVCTVEVRATAPEGIRALSCDAAPPPAPAA